ncbi:MAG: amidohydrolase [Nannocystaceae bacterium]|nr:amidohydrolase [Nannocystaceae bacterium]
MGQNLDEEIAALEPELREIRHDIHRHPELGFQERRTRDVIIEFLRRHGYEPRTLATTGVVADLHPDRVGKTKTIALRADIDCLPMPETTDLPYRSVHEGCAHKCGHDGHTAVLLGVALLLARHRDSVPGNVRLVFQPDEEGTQGGGAPVMIRDGALTDVAEIYGLHNWPPLARGLLAVRPGPMLAHVHNIALTVRGMGGHASEPQRCRDPIVAAAHMVTALQTVVSRGLGYDGGAVVSITQFVAGTTDNVIPGTAELGGTIRSFEPEATKRVLERVREVVEGTAKAFGVEANLELREGYPVLLNDPDCAAAVRRVAQQVVGADCVIEEGLPIAGGEDFAYYGREIPSAYFLVGAGEPGGSPTCHHPDFDFNDAIIPTAVGMFMGIVFDRLDR